MHISNNLPCVFLSSMCSDTSDIRTEAYNLVNNINGLPHLYVDEIDNTLTEVPTSSHHLNIVDDLAKRISEAKAVIVVLCNNKNKITNDHGSLIIASEVSFWEIELYHTANLKKPTYIIVEENFEVLNRPSLLHLLKILPHFAQKIFIEKRHCIPQRILEIVKASSHRAFLNKDKLLWHFQKLRSSNFDTYNQIFDGDISSMKYNTVLKANSDANVLFVRDCIQSAQNENSYQKKISRLYLGYRELLKSPYWLECDNALLIEWLNLAVDMRNSLCWYGVHGHVNLGVIQHLTDFAKIEQILISRDSNFKNLEHLKWKYTFLSSEYYSLYLMIGGNNLKKALSYVELGLKTGGVKNPLLSIRGACYLRSYKVFKAISDFEEVLNSLQYHCTDTDEIADMMVRLGHAYLLSGRITKGFDYANKGLEMFKREDGFKIRALRIVSQMHMLTLRPTKSKLFLQEAELLAKTLGAHGQLRQIKN